MSIRIDTTRSPGTPFGLRLTVLSAVVAVSALGLGGTALAASHSGTPAPSKASSGAGPADSPANAVTATCQQQASERKLAGAAKNSFLSRCEKEATERCEAAASERKLAGAARSSNVKKCVNQALGSPS